MRIDNRADHGDEAGNGHGRRRHPAALDALCARNEPRIRLLGALGGNACFVDDGLTGIWTVI